MLGEENIRDENNTEQFGLEKEVCDVQNKRKREGPNRGERRGSAKNDSGK